MSSSVFEKERADKLAVTYTPKKFPMKIGQVAESFHKLQTEEGRESKFRIERIIAEQTGISELERLSLEEKVEREALLKFKEVEEQAYQAAYQLGLEEGREKAFNDFKDLFTQKLNDIELVLGNLAALKQSLVTFNEAHILKLIYYIASRLAMDEIQTRPEVILTVIQKAIEAAQTEEQVVIRLSPTDKNFVDSMKDTLSRDMEILKKVKIEESENVKTGGCIVETNYGVVDATIEQRLEKLWESLSQKLPKVVDKFGA